MLIEIIVFIILTIFAVAGIGFIIFIAPYWIPFLIAWTVVVWTASLIGAIFYLFYLFIDFLINNIF